VRQPFEPWQVWWVDFNPIRGREQAKERPAVIVSSAHHLRLLRGDLITVMPLTTVERDWPFRIQVSTPGKTSWVITEQIRTVSALRVRGDEPLYTLSPSEIAAVRAMRNQMIG
jgi:mRNA interferase MazF